MRMSDLPPRILIIGAGVVGLSTALYLQRSSRQVTIIDPTPAGGASFGNAGMISADTAVPIVLPGMLGKLPGWLFDRLGPLSVDPAYLPRALPWLLRSMRAGRTARVFAISDAMRALHRNAFACWKELLGAERFYALIRVAGQVHVWETDAELRSAELERSLRQRHGIASETLHADDLRQMFPGISRAIRHGVLLPGNGYTINPQRLVRTLGELLLEAGGEVAAERAMKIIPQEGALGYTVMTNVGCRHASKLVVAAGAWSGRLLDPLGVRLPLETERGYHVMLPSPGIEVKTPITNKTRGFALTPMEGGLRIAGTVEFAGLDAPPNERRAEVLLEHARRMFAKVDVTGHSLWMGFRPSTPDSLPIVGAAPGRPGLYLAFGHGHFGMTGGPPSGRLLSRLITGREPDMDAAPYAPARFL
jgi:glycine/D-amino acid oxidase-like deaminating enzyme